MSSSSFSSSSSSESSPDTTTFPSSALAASRMRRHRRNAIAYQAELEWDTPTTSASASAAASPPPSTTTAQTPFSTNWSWTDPIPPPTTTPLPPRGDVLICPLASFSSPSSSFAFAFPHTDASSPDQIEGGNVDNDVQATLARFAFPSPTRKHRRSGESIDHHPTPPSAVGSGATRRCGTGPAKLAQCAHCEHARTSV